METQESFSVRRMAFCFFLALATWPACAGWVKVGVTEDSESEVFVDPVSVQQDRHFRKVWMLVDHKQSKANGEMSAQPLMEYDCKERLQRRLTLTTYTEARSRGSVLLVSLDPREWVTIAPQSAAESAYKIVCAN